MDDQSLQDNQVLPSSGPIPINSEKGIFSTEQSAEKDVTEIEPIPQYEVLKKQEAPSVKTSAIADDPSDTTASTITHVVDLRKKAPKPLPKPIRAILPNSDDHTKFAAETEQDFITSIKASHGN